MKTKPFRNWELKGKLFYGKSGAIKVTKGDCGKVRNSDECYRLRFNRGGRP